MKLFRRDVVKRFFDCLKTKGRGTYDKRENVSCEKALFVQRTLNKWYSGKCYKVVEYDAFDNPYFAFICVVNVSYHLGWGEAINVYYTSAAKMLRDKEKYGMGLGNVLEFRKLSLHQITQLEGKEITQEEYSEVASIFKVDFPEKEYVFKCYDLNKLKRKSKNNPDPIESCATTWSVKAQTELQAQALRKKEIEENDTFVGDLIEVITLKQ